MSIFRQIIIRIVYPNKYSSEAFVRYLKSIGIRIGDNTFFFDPIHTKIDVKRASYLSIGSGGAITSGVQFLCHDYSWSVLRKSHHVILPDPGRKIEIGDNVFIGWNTLIIGPVKIGSNVIIGANSVVTHDIPDNSVYAGNPARLISSLDEYYTKKKGNQINDAFKRVRHIIEYEHRKPEISDLGWFAVLFLDRTKENEERLRKLPFHGDNMDCVIQDFYATEKMFDSFDDFIHQATKIE